MPTRPSIVAVVLAGATAFAACERVADRPGPPASQPMVEPLSFQAPATRSGRMVLRGGELRFIACGEEGEGRVVEDLPDGSGKLLVRDLGSGEEGVSVMVCLEGGRLEEIRYGAPDGPGCDELPPEGDVVARGNEPFWSLRPGLAEAVLRTPDMPDGVRYRHGQWTARDDGRWLYEARRDHAGRVEGLTLEITEERCTDTMSGAWYPYRAVLTLDGDRMEGCALEGRRSRSTSPCGAARKASRPSSGSGLTNWIVADHRAPGVSAMSDAEAGEWHGRSIRLGADAAISGADTCSHPVYRESEVPADSFLAVEYRVRPEDLGLEGSGDPRMRVTEVLCGENRWGVMGDRILRLAEDRGYAVWDGVFFELRPADPGP